MVRTHISHTKPANVTRIDEHRRQSGKHTQPPKKSPRDMTERDAKALERDRKARLVTFGDDPFLNVRKSSKIRGHRRRKPTLSNRGCDRISDACLRLNESVAEYYPEGQWQRCVVNLV